MEFYHKYDFLESIEPSYEHVVDMQTLVLQDLLIAGIPRPQKIANPKRRKRRRIQHKKLSARPQDYCGFKLDGKIVAFLKHAPWARNVAEPFGLGDDNVPFSPGLDPNDHWAIYGLVVSESIHSVERNIMFHHLLSIALHEPGTDYERTVYIPIHDHDPILEVIADYGFVKVANRGEAPGVKGVQQSLYRSMPTH